MRTSRLCLLLPIVFCFAAAAIPRALAQDEENGLDLIMGVGGEPGSGAPAPLPEGASLHGVPAPGQERLALSPDGKRAATAGQDGSAHVYDLATLKPLFAFKAHEGGCNDVEFSADGKTLFTCGQDELVREWDLATRKERRKFQGHTAEVRNVAAAQNGLLLASSDAAGTIRVWDLKTGQLLHAMKGHGVELPPWVDMPVPIPTIDSLFFSPDSRTLLSEADDVTARLWDAERGIMLRTLREHDGSVAAIAIAPDGAHGASTRGAQSCPYGSVVRVWSVADGKVLRVLAHAADITCVAFSPDSRYVFTGSRDSTLHQWEADSGLELRRWHLKSTAVGLAMLPDGGALLSLSPREGLTLWKLDVPPLYDASSTFVRDDWDTQWEMLARPLYELRSTAASGILKRGPGAVAELARRISAPLQAEAAARIKRAVAALDDDNYSLRLEASEALTTLGPAARPFLVAALESPSLQVRVDAARLLHEIGGPRDIRFIMVCELLPLIGTPQARELLQKMGAGSAPEAAHARAVLRRWRK